MEKKSRIITVAEIPDSAIGRFWNKVKIVQNDCWLWQGALGRKGYGSFTVSRKFPTKIAHRVSYLIANRELDLDLQVCHSCDTPGCVNPDHLWQGTAKENSMDMVRKGRSPRGEKQGHSTLTKADIVAIRAMYSSGRFQQIEIAEKFKTSKGNIQHICANDTWRHIA